MSNDYSIVMYAAAPVNTRDPTGTYTFSYTNSYIPSRPFDFNTKEYWLWWKGYIAGNSITSEELLECIEMDRKGNK